MDSTNQLLALLAITVALVLVLIVTQFIRRRNDLFALRPIAAYDRLPALVSRSIEADQPLHLSLGSSGIGGESTLLSVTSAELAYQVAREVAIGDTSPRLTLTDGSALPLGQDTLRRAYAARNRLAYLQPGSVRYLPSGERSLAFAAAVTAMIHDERLGGQVLAGRHGPEIGLMLAAGVRYGLPAIAVSDQLEGQAVAYAMTEEPLIGEEVFAAGAYLEGSASQVGGMVTADMLRWLIIFVLLATFIGGFIAGD